MIAVFEAVKGAVTLAALLALAWIGPASLRSGLEQLASALGANIHQGMTARALAWITPDSLHIALLVMGLYGALRLVEAWGLWRNQAWASWLGCVSAALYLPADVYAIATHPGWASMLLLLVNAVVVWILARDLLRRRPQSRAQTP